MALKGYSRCREMKKIRREDKGAKRNKSHRINQKVISRMSSNITLDDNNDDVIEPSLKKIKICNDHKIILNDQQQMNQQETISFPPLPLSIKEFDDFDFVEFDIDENEYNIKTKIEWNAAITL